MLYGLCTARVIVHGVCVIATHVVVEKLPGGILRLYCLLLSERILKERVCPSGRHRFRLNTLSRQDVSVHIGGILKDFIRVWWFRCSLGVETRRSG